jgi:EAL domain-containing protein (putative c-di-GMP-specific phosphodiesterase class I)/GGDEF domain-containing protein
MTLFRQLALLISIFLLIILATVMSLNFASANKAAQQQLYEDAKNTATTLSLSLSTAEGDESIMATMINANFDSGHYKKIVLNDMKGNPIFERTLDGCPPDLPEWFVELVPIHAPTATAQVSSGWKPVGVLSVQSDNALAQTALYSNLKGLLVLFVLLGAVGLGLLYLMLAMVLKPLGTIRDQAEAISRNEFFHLEKIPRTREFKEIVVAMNAMVTKVEEIFNKGNEAIQYNRALLYTDELPKLYNYRYLMLKLPEYLSPESDYDGGVILVGTLEGAEDAAKRLSEGKLHDLLLSIASLFINYGAQTEKRIVARIDKHSFALLMPKCDEEMGRRIANRIVLTARLSIGRYGLEKEHFGVKIGAYRYNAGEGAEAVLEKAKKALALALGMKTETVRFFQDEHPVELSQSQWETIIDGALQRHGFIDEYWPVMDTAAKKLYQKVLTIVLQDKQGNAYSYGRFIAPAIRAKQVTRIYVLVLETLLGARRKALGAHECSVRLPEDFLKDPDAFEALEKLLEASAKKPTFRLCIELPENFVIAERPVAEKFVALCRTYGCRFGISEFSAESENLTYLQELKPAFVKMDRAFILDMLTASPQTLSSLEIVTDALGIKIIATGVRNEEELRRLESVHIHTVQGPVTETL